ncbi:CvpA family protein [Myroides sp. LJL110]
MILDLFVAIALIFGIYKGAKQGLFVSIAAFISLLIGVIIALKFSNVIKGYLYSSLGWDSSFLPIIAFVLTFFLAVLCVKLVAKLITHLLQAVYLGFLNRIFGAIFQILVVILLVSLFLSLFDKLNAIYPMISKQELELSHSYRIYQEISKHIFPSFFALIDSLFETSSQFIEKIEMP